MMCLYSHLATFSHNDTFNTDNGSDELKHSHDRQIQKNVIMCFIVTSEGIHVIRLEVVRVK